MEYVLFFLLFGAGYLFLLGAVSKILEISGRWLTDMPNLVYFSRFAHPLLCFAAHFLYPFKNVNENLRQHVNFFLFFLSLLSIAIAGFIFTFSNMK
jgi:hypothetical protein